ncbi:MAG: hypothetical protein OXQ90_17600 [Gammaproteobacteria bacterium]|nr:hypothetical protein [Gammaproteobacteria bacterium]
MTIQPGKTGIKTPVLAVVGAVVLFAVVAAWFFADRRGDPACREPDSVSASSVVAGVRAPPTTLPGIATIPDDFERNALLYEFIADADRNLIEQHLATMVDLPATPHRGDVVRVLYVRYAALDPAAATEHVLGGARNTSWVAAVFRVWAQVDLDAALNRAESLDPRLRAVVARAVFELDLTVAEREAVALRLDAAGELAAAPSQGRSYADLWGRAIETGRGRRGRIEAIALAWGKEDPEAAIAAIASLDDWGLHEEVVEEVLAGWLRGRPQEAGEWLAGLRPSMWSHSLTTDSLSRLLKEDVAAGLDAARAFRDVDFEDLVRGGFAEALEHDFEAAAAWLENAAGSSDTGLRWAYAHHYGRHAPREALDWAFHGEVDEDTRSRLLREVFRGIARTDLTLSRLLVDEVADPELRLDAALVVVGAGQADEWDVEDSLRLARSFRSEKHRARLISEVFSRWSRTYDLSYIGGSRGRVFRGDSSYDNADVAANAALALPSGVVRDAALASVMANVVGRDDALAERLFSGLGSSRYRAWSAARLYAHFADSVGDEEKSQRYRAILEVECGR